VQHFGLGGAAVVKSLTVVWPGGSFQTIANPGINKTIELDALGVVNGSRSQCYIVEIKSHLRQDGIEQMHSILQRFHTLFPEYAQFKLYGIIVAADTTPDALHEARKAGFYVITFEDDLMRFHDDDGFVPKAY
jgi:RecB family endonuclease NucS